jgi:RNA polymerase sigma factor (sigma-70 family)
MVEVGDNRQRRATVATAQTDTVIRHLRRAVLRQDARKDGQLLASFIDKKDEAAFEALVYRHGPMVFGVCRRVAANHHDAEDAFQATFLVLARKAASIRPREKVANWLHGVALRTAMKAKAMTAKRRLREKQVTEMPEPETGLHDPWHDLQPLLDQELHGLPENYRLPILLCDLEGKTIKEATQQLGWPQGTLATRLARGRKLLAKRLANRGVVLSAGSLAAIVFRNVASAGVPTSLMSSTIKAATFIAVGQATVAGLVRAKVAILTEGVLKAMLLSKLNTATMGLVLVALFIGAVGVIYQTQAAEQPNALEATAKADVSEQPADKAGPKKDQAPKKSLEGVWAVVSVEDNGKEKLDFDPIFSHVAGTQAPVRNARLTFRDGKFALKTGLVSLEGSYFLESSATAKEIILSVTAGSPDREGLLSICGVYSLDGDNLTITFGKLPASLVTGLAGKEPGVCYTLRREFRPKKEADEKKADGGTEKNITDNRDVSMSQVAPPPQAVGQREYAIRSRLLEAGADRPRELLRLPKVTVDDGQSIPLHITDVPQNLLEQVVLDEKIKVGTFCDVRVKRLAGNKVRLVLSFQRNEIESSSVSEIRVLGNSVQAIQDVELHKAVKVVFQKDAKGSAQRRVEITVDELTMADEEPVPPAASGGAKPGPASTMK